MREQAEAVSWQHFEIARDRMLLGKERVGFRARDTEWRTVAYHEAGHAIAGVVGCPDDGLHKVTIQPRGQAMGVAFFSPDDDRHLHSRRYLEGQIIKGLGGRVAEEIVFGTEQITGGAESDLVHVNRVARRMIYRLGMGADTGLLVYDERLRCRAKRRRAWTRKCARCSSACTRARAKSCSSTALLWMRSPSCCSSAKPSTARKPCFCSRSTASALHPQNRRQHCLEASGSKG